MTAMITNVNVECLTLGDTVSSVFYRYIEHLVSEWRIQRSPQDFDTLNGICELPFQIWNATVLDDFYPLAFDRSALSDIFELRPGKMNQSLINFWVNRKRTDFPQYRYLFDMYDVYEGSEGDYHCRASYTLPREVKDFYGQYGQHSTH